MQPRLAEVEFLLILNIGPTNHFLSVCLDASKAFLHFLFWSFDLAALDLFLCPHGYNFSVCILMHFDCVRVTIYFTHIRHSEKWIETSKPSSPFFERAWEL